MMFSMTRPTIALMLSIGMTLISIRGAIAQNPAPVVPPAVQGGTARIACSWKGQTLDATGMPVKINTSYAVGFLVSEKQLITAAHAFPCVAPASLEIDCQFEKALVAARLVKIDRKLDLALLELDVVPAGAKPLVIRQVRLNPNVAVAGVYLSLDLRGQPILPITTGTVNEVKPRVKDAAFPGYFTASMQRAAGSGSSGAPVVLQPAGDVVGMTLGLHQVVPPGNGPRANAVDTLIAIDAAEIAGFLKAAAVPCSNAASWVSKFEQTTTVTLDVGQYEVRGDQPPVAPDARPLNVLNFNPVPRAAPAANVQIPNEAWFADYRTVWSPPMPVGPFQLPQAPMAMMFFGSDKGFNDPPGIRIARNFGAGFTTLVPPVFAHPVDEVDVAVGRVKTVFNDQFNRRKVTVVTRPLAPLAPNDNTSIIDLLIAKGIDSRQKDIGLYLPNEVANVPPGGTIVRPGMLEGLRVPDAINPMVIRTFYGIWNSNNQYAHAFRHYEANGRSWVVMFMYNRPQLHFYTVWFECPTVELNSLRAPPPLRTPGLSEQILLLLGFMSDP